jgi:hypothetical protein
MILFINYYVEKEFKSSYFIIHGKEPKVTHLTHGNEQLGVDFIFYQSNILQPISSELIPRGCDQQIWNDDYFTPIEKDEFYGWPFGMKRRNFLFFVF